jgi:phage head maturation protease
MTDVLEAPTDGPVDPDPNAQDNEPGAMPEVSEAEVCPSPGCLAINDVDAEECSACGATLSGSDGNQDAEGEEGDGVEEGTVPARSAGPPRENLIRARYGAGVQLREAGDGADGTTMFGHFSVFNSWYEVDSYWEGTFLESVASSAFDRTMVDDRAGMKVLYDHGFDPVLGNKPLGPITTLRADDIGAYYEVPLLDTDYNRDFVLPALRGQLMNGQNVGSQLGASFRFMVLDEIWEQKPEPSSFNPTGLPQRTITRAQVMEFGPVTFPASPDASAGVRSLTDEFIDHLHHDAKFLARYTERAGLKVVEPFLSKTAAVGEVTDTEIHASAGVAHDQRVRQLHRRAQMALADM